MLPKPRTPYAGADFQSPLHRRLREYELTVPKTPNRSRVLLEGRSVKQKGVVHETIIGELSHPFATSAYLRE